MNNHMKEHFLLLFLLPFQNQCLSANVFHEYPGSESYVNIRFNEEQNNFHNHHHVASPISRPRLRLESLPPHPPLPPLVPISSVYHPSSPQSYLHHHQTPLPSLPYPYPAGQQVLALRHTPVPHGFQPLNQAYSFRANLIHPPQVPFFGQGFPYEATLNPYFNPLGPVFSSPIFSSSPESTTKKPSSTSTIDGMKQDRTTETVTESTTEVNSRPESKTKSSKKKPKSSEKLQDVKTETKKAETTTMTSKPLKTTIAQE